MAKIVACIIARTVSQRLPLKVLRDIRNGVSIIELLIDRIKTIKLFFISTPINLISSYGHVCVSIFG